jgi:hypothetical protein
MMNLAFSEQFNLSPATDDEKAIGADTEDERM